MKTTLLSLLTITLATLIQFSKADMVAYWDFNGNLDDATGAGNDGTILNNATYGDDTPTDTGQSLSVPGGAENNGVLIPGTNLGSNPFTLSYWIKPTSATANAGLERITSRGGDQFETGIGNAGGVGGTSSETGTTLSYYPGGGGWQVTNVPITINEWTHVAWSVSPESTILYINGEEAYVGIGASADKPGTNDFFIGTRHNSVEGYEGFIDEMFVWDDSENPLSPDQIALFAEGINPFSSDEDEDGLPDSWEDLYGLDPEDDGSIDVVNGPDGDGDEDGLINIEEFEQHTNPTEADTDDDGSEDGFEVDNDTDPLDPDSDDDDIMDGEEFALGTDPMDPDTDRDGFNDGFELDQETDPKDPESFPVIETGPGLIIYDVEQGSVGNQNFQGALGMDFEVSTVITVTELGAFDSGSDGLSRPITVELWKRDGDFGVEILAEKSFDANDEGALEGGHRFKMLDQPIILEPGSYTIVGTGYGPGEPNINTSGQPAINFGMFTDDAGGVITFVGGSRWGNAGAFPGTLDGGPEQRYGAGSFKIVSEDNDDDGMPDAWEEANGLDPENAEDADGDGDNDGLSNLSEFERGLNPKLADTDEDGVEDGTELNNDTNPLNPDTDDDGLTEGEEITAGTDPTNPDSDGDGYTDGRELSKGTDPLDSSSTPSAADSLVLYLDFEDQVEDQSGHENNGTILNDISFESDPLSNTGMALSLAEGGGENNGIRIPGTDLGSNPFTLSYWIKPTTAQANAGLERVTSRGGDQFETAVGDAGAVGGTTSETGTTLSYYCGGCGWRVTNVPITVGEWVHVTWVISPDSTILYINGEEAYTGIGITGPGTNDFFIGTRHNQVEGFEGLIDELRVYSEPLSAQNVLDVFNDTGENYIFQILELEHDDETPKTTITWASKPGRIYSVWFSNDLKTWSEIDDSIVSGGETTSFVDDFFAAENLRSGFYQVREN